MPQLRCFFNKEGVNKTHYPFYHMSLLRPASKATALQVGGLRTMQLSRASHHAIIACGK